MMPPKVRTSDSEYASRHKASATPVPYACAWSTGILHCRPTPACVGVRSLSQASACLAGTWPSVCAREREVHLPDVQGTMLQGMHASLALPPFSHEDIHTEGFWA